MRALLTWCTTIAIAGCSPYPSPTSCGLAPTTFGSWTDLPYSIDGHHVNRIDVAPGGRLRWNGTPLTDGPTKSRYDVLGRYLAISAQLIPVPSAALVFRKGASCADVNRVRALMERHLACSRNRPYCLQGAGPGREG